VHVHLSVSILYVSIHSWLCVQLIYPLWYHLCHSSTTPPPSFICKFLLQKWGTWHLLSIHVLNCWIPEPIWSRTKNVTYIDGGVGEILYQIQCFYAGPFAIRLKDYTHFQNFVLSNFYPKPLQWGFIIHYM
jgi:hypothetical protein